MVDFIHKQNSKNIGIITYIICNFLLKYNVSDGEVLFQDRNQRHWGPKMKGASI